MSSVLINPAPPLDEQANVEAIFQQMEEHLGFVPDGLRLYGISPPLLQSFVGAVGYFREGSSLPPLLTTMIRYLVSDTANCQFCVDLNEGFLASMGVDLDAARAAREDINLAPVSAKELALLKLATRSVDLAEQVVAGEIEAVRSVGWNDREIFDAVAQAASNRAFNHVLKTFGVEQQGAFV